MLPQPVTNNRPTSRIKNGHRSRSQLTTIAKLGCSASFAAQNRLLTTIQVEKRHQPSCNSTLHPTTGLTISQGDGASAAAPSFTVAVRIPSAGISIANFTDATIHLRRTVNSALIFEWAVVGAAGIRRGDLLMQCLRAAFVMCSSAAGCSG